MIAVLPRVSAIGLLLLAAVSPALSQPNDPPKASLKLAKMSAMVGEQIAGTVRIEFADGLHGYQNPPSEQDSIPVSVSLKSGGFQLVSVTYPRGELKEVGGATKPVAIYSGAIEILIVIKATASRQKEIEFEIGYQQCTDEKCYPPESLSITSGMVVVEGIRDASPQQGGGQMSSPPPGKQAPSQVNASPRNQGKPTGQPKSDQVVRPQPTLEPSTAKPPSTDAIQKPVPNPDTPVSSEPAAAKGPAPPLSPEQEAPPIEGTTETSESGWVEGLIRNGFEQGNYLIVLIAAALTGLALALTPCVYPMIPVTISFFSNQVGGSRGARAGLGFIYLIGIAATYGAVGGIFAAAGRGIGGLFTQPWFLLALAALMFALALSMFGVYEIGIPKFIGKRIHGRSGPIGALAMGFLVGFAAAPCSGPLVIGVATEIAKLQSIPIGIMVFTAIGVGMGLPFFALGAFATGAKSLPRAGGWLTTFKSILGIVVLWLALDYFLKGIQFRAGEPRTFLVQALFFVAAAAYLFLLENSGSSRAIMAMKGIAILACGLFAGQAWQMRTEALRLAEFQKLTAGNKSVVPQKVDWIPFTKESFEEAKRSGKPIVIDASADWCLVCKEIEHAVFDQPKGIVAMREVIALRVDHSTGVSDEYIDMTSELLGIKGLPHIEIMKPGGEEVKVVTGKSELDTPEKLIGYLKLAGASF